MLSLFRSKPRPLPFEIKVMERHLLGSQAFIPLSRRPYLVIVAAPGQFDERTTRFFFVPSPLRKSFYFHFVMFEQDVGQFGWSIVPNKPTQ